MIEKKRPIGVSVIAWSTIMLYISAILLFIPVVIRLHSTNAFHVAGIYGLMTISLLLFISAIYLLRLKNWSRVIIISISVGVVILDLLLVAFIARHAQEQILHFEQNYNQQNYNDMLKRRSDISPATKQILTNNKALLKMFYIALLIIMPQVVFIGLIIFHVGIIYYLTRPRVKEQFKKIAPSFG